MAFLRFNGWRAGAALVLTFAAASLSAQTPNPATAPVDGIRSKPLQRHALRNATVVAAPGQVLNNATILIDNGVIAAVGTNVRIPQGTPTTDLAGKWVYPGWIDAYSHVGLPDVKPAPGGFGTPGDPSPKPGAYHWNPAVQPERNVADEWKPSADDAAKQRSMGFALAHVLPNDGILRGSSALVAMTTGTPQDLVLRPGLSLGMAFDKGSSKHPYPTSLTGTIALIRQTLLDAQWYRGAQAKAAANPAAGQVETNYSLAALGDQMARRVPVFFPAANNNDVERALRLAEEFRFPLVVLGSGTEYERLDALAPQFGAGKAQLVLPLSFPDAPDVEDPADALTVSLTQLRRWEQAPANAVWLHQKNLPFALSAFGLKDAETFWTNLRTLVALGLPEAKALEALTLQPARLLGIDRVAGSIAAGKRADLLVASGNVFATGTVVHQVWVGGTPHDVNPAPEYDPRGTWSLRYDGKTDSLVVSGEPAKYSAKLKRGNTELSGSLAERYGAWTLAFPADTGKAAGQYRLQLAAPAGSAWQGSGTSPTGGNVAWSAQRVASYQSPGVKPLNITPLAQITPYTYPNNGYGFLPGQLPKQGTVLLQGATVWTNTDRGILTEADVLIQNGKVAAVGPGLNVPAGATVVNARGRHVTSGIIDEHSHIALERGVNESAQAITAEVRMGDVLNPEQIFVYYQLAGGVTAAQLLHGSANPIGGQSQLVKLRWGQGPEQFKLENAPRFMKFALGENVKQTHWGERSSRYPKTRMGVEQLIKDAFQAAKEYKAQWEAWRTAGGDKSSLLPPRRDLELEALREVLDNERYITCHSYVQSEITMLIRLAEEMGFRVNTFTHILEGYKVADKMAAHGAGGSTFADWWAYKNEVYEAIPQNPGLMAQQGVVVAINSDDAEMARRLNQEAAKSVQAVGMPEEQAWKMVTLNPARLLHLDDRMGSLAPGKDADVVVWTDNPLSIYAKPVQTYVDGRLLFDAERDAAARQRIAEERNRLIQKLLQAKRNGTKVVPVSPSRGFGDRNGHFCDDFSDHMAGTDAATADQHTQQH